jgi:creatinine amidohydrolase
MRPWILAESTLTTVRQYPYEVAVLPLGATEPHNLHLPHAQDTLEGQLVGEKICEAAWNRGARVVLLPAVPYGTDTNLMGYPLAMNVQPSTLHLLISDLVDSLVHHGIRKILLLNSHGGNDFKPLLREMYGRTAAQLFLCNWYHMFLDVYSEYFNHRDDHAGEMETSLGLAYWPELVARNDDGSIAADEGQVRQTKLDAVNQGWVSITRPWHLLTTNAGVGNPLEATAEKGERLVDLLVERLGTFLVDLAGLEIDERFPY